MHTVIEPICGHDTEYICNKDIFNFFILMFDKLQQDSITENSLKSSSLISTLQRQSFMF